MSAGGGAVAFKVCVERREKWTAVHGKPVYGMARFAESVAGSDEFAGAAVFDGVFQPKTSGFGKVAGCEPPINGFPRVAAAF